MQIFLTRLAETVGFATTILLIGAILLHLIPLLGEGGRRLGGALCRAPGLDVVVGFFIVLPLVAGPLLAGWPGLLGAIVGQFISLQAWVFVHELTHRPDARGPRIVTVINRFVGRWRNHAALWVTAPVAPLLWLVRVVEVMLYPPLTWLIGLPAQRHDQWVNVSRHKFKGLVGHDLIWCLYCDWMTGTWSLGSEMLRNVESFWCPIRFDHGKKCENCSVDFPDIFGGWVAPDGTMADVVQTLEQKYASGERAWFGRRVPLTVQGQRVIDA